MHQKIPDALFQAKRVKEDEEEEGEGGFHQSLSRSLIINSSS